MLDTKARKGLRRVSSRPKSVRRTYNCPDKAEPVEIEEELKAEHCVEPARDMQLCAKADGARNAKSSGNIDLSECVVIFLLFFCMSTLPDGDPIYYCRFRLIFL